MSDQSWWQKVKDHVADALQWGPPDEEDIARMRRLYGNPLKVTFDLKDVYDGDDTVTVTVHHEDGTTSEKRMHAMIVHVLNMMTYPEKYDSEGHIHPRHLENDNA